MRTGNKRNGGLASFFFRGAGNGHGTRPISRSEIEAPILQISSPNKVERVAHISYRAATGLFSGLDSDVSLFFGVPIISQPRFEVSGYDERIPSMLTLLVRELVKRSGLLTEGIFRVPGESTSIETSRMTLNCGKGMSALEDDQGPHVIASLIKDWFRSLPQNESLLEKIPNTKFAELARDEEKSHAEIYEIISQALDEPNRSVFKWIIDLLAVVCAHQDKNKMSPPALATVFAPTLRVPEATVESFAILADVSKIVERCITHIVSSANLESKEQVFAS